MSFNDINKLIPNLPNRKLTISKHPKDTSYVHPFYPPAKPKKDWGPWIFMTGFILFLIFCFLLPAFLIANEDLLNEWIKHWFMKLIDLMRIK